MPQLAQLYAELPGAKAPNAISATGDGSTLCAARDGEHYEYVVDRAGGDCPSGCTEHEAFHFTSHAAGQVTRAEEWRSGSAPRPPWFAICGR
jgi:hypothetical protein